MRNECHCVVCQFYCIGVRDVIYRNDFAEWSLFRCLHSVLMARSKLYLYFCYSFCGCYFRTVFLSIVTLHFLFFISERRIRTRQACSLIKLIKKSYCYHVLFHKQSNWYSFLNVVVKLSSRKFGFDVVGVEGG